MKRSEEAPDGSDEHNGKNFSRLDSMKNRKKMNKNMQRLGGKSGGLSLEAFANAKTRNNSYNPAAIKKQREFYKNAKYIRKFKKSLNQQVQQSDPSSSSIVSRGENESNEAGDVNYNKRNKKSGQSLRDLYEKKREEEEKERKEREAMIQAKKEERQRAEARRKALKGKMFKKTRSGQPVMKYRIEHILETLQKETS